MKNITWIRITKSGGSSIYDKLKNNTNINYYTPTIESYNKFKNNNNNDLIIANVREPFQKIYSAYNFLKKESNNRCNKIIKKDMSFYDFLLCIIDLREKCDTYNIELFNGIYCTSKKMIFGDLNYQTYWVLSHVESNIDSIEFFTKQNNVTKIRVENIDNDLKKIFPDIKLNKLNKSTYSKIKYDDLDEKCKQLFNKLYKHDLEFYKSLD